MARTQFPWGKVLLGAAVLGIPAYVLLSSNNANAAPLPPSSPRRTTPTGATSGPASPALVALLTSSKVARRTFWFQSLLYSVGYTPASGPVDPPDGAYGPHTKSYYEDITFQPAGSAPSTLPTSVFQDASSAANDIILATPGRQMRLIPMTLPQSVIDTINSEARGAYSQAIPLPAAATA